MQKILLTILEVIVKHASGFPNEDNTKVRVRCQNNMITKEQILLCREASIVHTTTISKL